MAYFGRYAATDLVETKDGFFFVITPWMPREEMDGVVKMLNSFEHKWLVTVDDPDMRWGVSV